MTCEQGTTGPHAVTVTHAPGDDASGWLQRARGSLSGQPRAAKRPEGAARRRDARHEVAASGERSEPRSVGRGAKLP